MSRDEEVDELSDGQLAEELAACRALGSFTPEQGAAVPLRDDPRAMQALASRVRERIAAETGPLAQLRALPTRLRLLVMFATVATLVVMAALLLPRREDLAAYPLWRMILTVASFALLAMAASWRLLRPLHLPPANPRLELGLLLVGLGVPCVLAVIPLSHQGVAAGQGAVFAAECGRCAAFGAVMGLPVLALALLAGRSRVHGVVAALAGVAAGLTGNLALQLHCPNTNVWHQLLGHWVVLLVLPLATALWCARRA